jgi:hypothetical protein
MIKNAKFTKKMAIMLFVIGGIVGVIAIALITINASTFMTAVNEAVQGGQGTSKDLYDKYFVSQVLVYALNIISVQGGIAALSIIGGMMLLKSTKSDEETVVEVVEEIESTENDESADETELN